MNFHPTEELLARYAGRETSESEAAIVRAHLNHCPECRLVLSDFHDLAATLVEALAEPDRNEVASLHGRILQRISAPRRFGRELFAGGAAAAAAMLAICLTFIPGVIHRPHRDGGAPTEIRDTPEKFALGLQQHSQLPRQLPNLDAQNFTLRNVVLRSKPRRTRAGLRAISLVSSADGQSQLKMTTEDPNVVLLLPLTAGGEAHEN